MMRILIAVGICLFIGTISAQDTKFSVEVSTDTVLLGNYFELKFTVENVNGEFEAPDLSKFLVVGGPNTSSSFSMINGEISQSATYTYFLEPSDIGNYTIPPAYVSVEETILETPPVEIIAVPNPDGLIQQPHQPSRQFMNPVKPKPDKKSKRPRKKF